MSSEKMGFEKNRRFQKDYHNTRTTAFINGKTCNFRSKGEFQIAKYLQFLKDFNQIKDWAYEQTKFCFPSEQDPVKTWLVDFDVINNDGTFYYIEFKGHVEPDTKRKLILLAKYKPEVQVDMVFYGKADMKRLGSKATACCRRVCLLKDLTKGII